MYVCRVRTQNRPNVSILPGAHAAHLGAGVTDLFEIFKNRPLLEKRFAQIERPSNLG